MVEVLTLEVYLSSAKLSCELICAVEQRRSACIVIKELCKLAVEVGVIFIVVVSLFKLYDRIHKCFGDILTAVNTETSF